MVAEMAVAMVQADLCLPGACVGLGAAVTESGGVAVGPGGLDQQPPRVSVAEEPLQMVETQKEQHPPAP